MYSGCSGLARPASPSTRTPQQISFPEGCPTPAPVAPVLLRRRYRRWVAGAQPYGRTGWPSTVRPVPGGRANGLLSRPTGATSSARFKP
jgi:hypothetical protein